MIKEDPPNLHYGAKYEYTEIAEKLMNDLGTWYRILDDVESAQTAHYIKSGKLRAFRPAGAFEARQQKQPDGTFIVWARFVGEV